MEQRRKMLSAKEVSELLDISNSYAYKVINQLNKELEKAGYLEKLKTGKCFGCLLVLMVCRLSMASPII